VPPEKEQDRFLSQGLKMHRFKSAFKETRLLFQPLGKSDTLQTLRSGCLVIGQTKEMTRVNDHSSDVEVWVPIHVMPGTG